MQEREILMASLSRGIAFYMKLIAENSYAPEFRIRHSSAHHDSSTERSRFLIWAVWRRRLTNRPLWLFGKNVINGAWEIIFALALSSSCCDKHLFIVNLSRAAGNS